MKFLSMGLGLGLGLGLSALVSVAHADRDTVQWGITVGSNLPAPVVVSVPPPVPVAVVPVPRPIAPALPNIEQIQSQQQARILWGAQVGLISQREYNRLQQTQQYIEDQRRWAYSDGWLTYDEHLNLINLLNGAVPAIEHALLAEEEHHNRGNNHGNGWGRGRYHHDDADTPMPPALVVWNSPAPNVIYKTDEPEGRGRLSYRKHHPQISAVQTPVVAVPTAISVKPVGSSPPLPPSNSPSNTSTSTTGKRHEGEPAVEMPFSKAILQRNYRDN